MSRWLRWAAVAALLAAAALAARQIHIEHLGSSSASLGRAVASERSQRIFSAVSARRLLQMAEVDEAGRLQWLEAAVAANPYSSEGWMALGLAREQRGRMEEAEQALLEAARADHQYLPAWTLANFYFRQRASERFWSWAERAAALTHDDYRPLIRLAARMEADAGGLLGRIGAGPGFTRAYLDFLIGEGRLEAAGEAARRLASFGDPSDRARLEAFEQRLRTAGRRNR